MTTSGSIDTSENIIIATVISEGWDLSKGDMTWKARVTDTNGKKLVSCNNSASNKESIKLSLIEWQLQGQSGSDWRVGA